MRALIVEVGQQNLLDIKMKSVIYKYPLLPSVNSRVSIPEDHTFLRVENQGDQIMIWALVDPLSQEHLYDIKIVGTGHTIGGDGEIPRYLGTVFQGSFVWHIFGNLK